MLRAPSTDSTWIVVPSARRGVMVSLAGDAVMTLYAGADVYSEPGATASDLAMA